MSRVGNQSDLGARFWHSSCELVQRFNQACASAMDSIAQVELGSNL
jgi:hypothetical protein